jgi:hypothetical protein
MNIQQIHLLYLNSYSLQQNAVLLLMLSYHSQMREKLLGCLVDTKKNPYYNSFISN